MAATEIFDCRVCGFIVTSKNRRTIFRPEFQWRNELCKVLDYSPSQDDRLSPYACSMCYGKLGRLNRLETEQNLLFLSLKDKQKSARKPVCVTPKGITKRIPDRSPTPRKTKVCKTLFSSTSTNYHQPDAPDDTESLITTCNKSTMTCTPKKINSQNTILLQKRLNRPGRSQLFTPSKVKVMYRSKTNKVTARLVRTGCSIVKNLAKGASKKTVAVSIYKDSALRDYIKEFILKDLEKEVKCATSMINMSSLRRADPKSLLTFNFDKFCAEMQLYAPFLYQIVAGVVRQSTIGIAVSFGIMLKFQNVHMSALQHMIGQILDNGGATDETIALMNRLGLSVSTDVLLKKRKELLSQQKSHIHKLLIDEKETTERKGKPPEGETKLSHTGMSSDIIGDNLDLSKSPSKMTMDKKRQSWHWFLLVGLQRRVVDPTLDDTAPLADIKKVENSQFVPSVSECSLLEEHFIFHITQILVKHMDCFKGFKDCLPKYIDHPHVKESSVKSDYVILDLLEKNENLKVDIISILGDIHEKYMSKSDDEDPSVVRKKVFGGDCLTNERAYTGQLAMDNSDGDFDKRAGLAHRPEGLHRMMNLLLFIYKKFYKVSSVNDEGTLASLRNTVGRISVHGPEEVVAKYRAHYDFVEDTLDSYVVAACMDLLNMPEVSSECPRKLPMFSSKETRCDFITTIAREILEKYIKNVAVEEIQTRLTKLDKEKEEIANMFSNEKNIYCCSVCGKQYKTTRFLKKHLVDLHDHDDWETNRTGDSCEDADIDHMAAYRASFMKCALLLRDTNDAYKMGDGERVTVNAKFQLLLSHIGGHTKYRLWLFRFLAYILALLSPRMSYEYKWNCSTSLQGGIGNNIPNDNLVEIQVQKIKKKIQTQGSNVTFKSARDAALSMQIQDEIKQNMCKESEKRYKSKKRGDVSKEKDICEMVKELKAANVMAYIPGRCYPCFPKFKEIYSECQTSKLHEWISEWKATTALHLT